MASSNKDLNYQEFSAEKIFQTIKNLPKEGGIITFQDYNEMINPIGPDEPEETDPRDIIPFIIKPPESFRQIAQKMEPIHEHVQKKIIQPGILGLIPEDGIVTFHYECYFEGQEEPYDSTFSNKIPYRFELTNPNLMEGLVISLKSMQVQEISHFLINWPVAYGLRGCPMTGCPPKGNLFAVIQVTKVDTKEVKSNDFETNMKKAEEYLNQGKKLFIEVKSGTIEMHRALDYLKKIVTKDVEEQAKAYELKLRVHANLAGIYNWKNRPESAIIHAREALLIDPNCKNALIAMGRAHPRFGNFQCAKKFLEKGAKLYPDDPKFTKLLDELEEKKKKYPKIAHEVLNDSMEQLSI